MAISVLLLIISATVLLFLIPHSKYGLPMFLMVVGVILTTLSVLFQYYSFGSYMPPSYLPLRDLDIFLYRNIGQRIRLSMLHMQTLKNIGVIIYLWGILALTDVIKSNLMLRKQSSPAVNIVSKALFVAGCIFYLMFYSTKTSYYAYRRYIYSGRSARFFTGFNLIHIGISIVIGVYMFYPLFLFIFNVIKKKVTCFTGTKVILILSVLLTNSYFYYFIFVSILKNDPREAVLSGFWFFNRVTRFPAMYISVYPLFALFMLVFIILNINGFFAVDLLSYSQNRLLKKQIDAMNYNLKDVFHSEKNLMFSINILAREIKDSYGSDTAKEKLDRIIEISDKQMDSLSRSLNSIKQLHIKPGAVDLKELTEGSITNSSVPADVTVVRNYCDAPAFCTIDQYHTGHAFTNLINNSVDSLLMSDSEDKRIEITIDTSKDWIYWSIKDNGLGIDKRAVRKILMPFVSTKSKNTGWGIGLPYAFKVINMQLGQMKISGSTQESRHYALVEILLPRRKKENG